jgi:hypothetical protein
MACSAREGDSKAWIFYQLLAEKGDGNERGQGIEGVKSKGVRSIY